MTFRITFPLVVATLLLIAGCSGDEGNKEQGVIEKQTEQTAKAAVEAIKTPLDQARSAAGQQDDHTRALQEQAGDR